MVEQNDIIGLSAGRQVLLDELKLCKELERNIPGTVYIRLQQFKTNEHMQVDDTGMIVYELSQSDQSEPFIELQFCIDTANTLQPGKKLVQQQIAVFHLRFGKEALLQYQRGRGVMNTSDHVISFSHPTSFTKTLSLCSRTRIILEALANNKYIGTMENIFINSQVHTILLHSLECLEENKPESFACKFLAKDEDRKKITLAREILLKSLEEQMTIKELSKLVGINECYLKKGFKELFGTTIFEFYQGQRMEHAKYLLYEKGLTVTQVAYYLNYSNISHFSTAFRKYTGIKPCELLLGGNYLPANMISRSNK